MEGGRWKEEGGRKLYTCNSISIDLSPHRSYQGVRMCMARLWVIISGINSPNHSAERVTVQGVQGEYVSTLF
jgi:hypothetical protein